MLRLPAMRGLSRVVGFAVIVGLLLFIGSLFFATQFVTGTINYVVSNLASRSGLSPFLVRGLVIIITIPFFWAVAKFTRNILGLLNLGWAPLSLYRNSYGLIIIAYIAGFFLAMFWSSREAYAYKYCGDTPEGIFVSDGTGKDPVYGVELKPCSLDQIKELRNGTGNLHPPTELTISDADSFAWYNAMTGKPRVWYSILPNGDYRFFDRPGTDPHSGQLLQPISPEIVQHLRQAEQSLLQQQRHTAQVQIEEEKRRMTAASEKDVAERRATDLASLEAQGQNQFERGDYKGARESCERALSIDRKDLICATIHQRSGVKLAQEFVKKGQQQFQEGQIEEAIWSADSAIALDPTNSNAIKLKKLATLTKPHSLN